MCVHPIEKLENSTQNKIIEELSEINTDMDSLNKFSKQCTYVNAISDLHIDNGDLTVMHLNIRSLFPKQKELLKLLDTGDVDVCLLNETWLH